MIGEEIVNNCLICNTLVEPFMSFGQMPIANGFLSSAQFANEYFFELQVAFCLNCRMVQLTVEDNGKGFDERVVGQVFEPYVTTKDKGTGLGLAIVKKIVEEHGGMITAANGEQGGGCLTLRLPVVDRTGHVDAACQEQREWRGER